MLNGAETNMWNLIKRNRQNDEVEVLQSGLTMHEAKYLKIEKSSHGEWGYDIEEIKTMECKQCGSELKLIPAGFSKTSGKPYEAFYACPNRCKGFKPPVTVLPEKSPDWDKIRDEKADSISWMNAKNAAALAYANGKITKEQIKEFANWFNNLEPEAKKQAF